MEKFGVTEAAFDVFKRRARSGVLTQAVIAYALATIAIGISVWLIAAGGISSYMRWIQDMQQNPPQPGSNPFVSLPAEVARLFYVYLGIIPLFLGLAAAFEAAVHRWLVRGEAGGGLLGLKIDGAFWNVLLCYLTWIPVGLVVVVLVGILLGVGIGGGAASGGGLVGFLLGLVGVLSAIAVGVYLPARFAPAAALSVARGRYAFFEAWGATRGRALNLIGAYLLLFVIFLVVSLIWQVTMSGLLKRVMSGVAEAHSFGAIFSIVDIGTLIAVAVSYLAVTVFQMVINMAVFGINAMCARVAVTGDAAGTVDPLGDANPA